MHGWDLDEKEKKEIKICWNGSVVIIQIHSDTEKLKRENLISVSLEMHLIYFSIWEAHIDNIKSNNFLWGIYLGFSCLQLCSSPVQEKTYVRQAVSLLYVPGIHSVQWYTFIYDFSPWEGLQESKYKFT